ncbi:hypothetical protein BX661DRAFT_89296 [Kickxella alabastrina]|uniref:uncharacterized protein n=1 Tax=Kickxella alabastrina TaxID=61397 RepID=UPI00221EF72A|nr:uncharacterized protein BX661DRAFT_89296 [Kickxella alabastrina]KAI7830780.1 hypothetical protein BX661DRAFT_89296 [Kickxella alabastrina]
MAARLALQPQQRTDHERVGRADFRAVRGQAARRDQRNDAEADGRQQPPHVAQHQRQRQPPRAAQRRQLRTPRHKVRHLGASLRVIAVGVGLELQHHRRHSVAARVRQLVDRALEQRVELRVRQARRLTRGQRAPKLRHADAEPLDLVGLVGLVVLCVRQRLAHQLARLLVQRLRTLRRAAPLAAQLHHGVGQLPHAVLGRYVAHALGHSRKQPQRQPRHRREPQHVAGVTRHHRTHAAGAAVGMRCQPLCARRVGHGALRVDGHKRRARRVLGALQRRRRQVRRTHKLRNVARALRQRRAQRVDRLRRRQNAVGRWLQRRRVGTRAAEADAELRVRAPAQRRDADQCTDTTRRASDDRRTGCAGSAAASGSRSCGRDGRDAARFADAVCDRRDRRAARVELLGRLGVLAQRGHAPPLQRMDVVGRRHARRHGRQAAGNCAAPNRLGRRAQRHLP